MRKIPPAWFLFFFAPLTAEYVSGSSPYLNPFILLANLLLYGGGTLLIRELKVRWHKGWLAVFILALAYVIAEEGLMLNTLFDPTKNNVGRMLDVNWVWTVGMLIVHSLVSIFVPILFAEAIYDDKAREPWMKPWMFYVLLALFIANVFGLGRLFAPSHRPGAVYYIVEIAMIGACLWLANHAPSPQPGKMAERASHSPLWLYVASLVGMLATMLASSGAPALPVPAIAKIAVMMAVYLAFLGLLHHIGAFDVELDPLSKCAVASGIISFWILASPLMAVAKGNAGPVIFAALMAALLAHGHNRLKQRLPFRIG